jgi:hypothetical protein
MQIENLQLSDMDKLEEILWKLHENDSSIVLRKFHMDEAEQPDSIVTTKELLQQILEKVEKLERTIQLIFSDYVLIDGQFHSVHKFKLTPKS